MLTKTVSSRFYKRRYIAVIAICSCIFSMLPVSAQEWSTICVVYPDTITPSNKASIKGRDCAEVVRQATLQGKQGFLSTFSFRDGKTISIFRGECTDRFGPCRVKISVNSGEWIDGVYELPSALIHNCGQYACNWHVYRDGYGSLVRGTGMSY